MEISQNVRRADRISVIDMKDLPGIVFPHVYLPEKSLRRILSFFGTITLFQPWFFEGLSPFPEDREAGPVRVLNPPEGLKPGQDFKARLSEYKNWIAYNQDKSFRDFITATRGVLDEEDKVWDIRKSLREGGRPRSTPDEIPSLKWHLVLHLAGEVEKDQEEADSLLGALKERSSPVQDAIEEEAREQARGLFDDLPRFKSDRILDEFLMEQVLEAWFGLFGSMIRDQDLLVTTSGQLMDYVTGVWHEVCGREPDAPVPAVQFRFPDLSGYSLDELFRIRDRDFNGEKVRELKAMLSVPQDDPAGRFSVLENLAREVEDSCRTLWDGETITIRVSGPLPSCGAPYGREVFTEIFGRTIVLVEETASRE